LSKVATPLGKVGKVCLRRPEGVGLMLEPCRGDADHSLNPRLCRYLPT